MSISDRIRKLIASPCGWVSDGSSKKEFLFSISDELNAIADELDAAEVKQASPIKPKWQWGKPDKLGVWLFGRSKASRPQPTRCMRWVDSDKSISIQHNGWWLYVCPIPEAEYPALVKQYRPPEIADMDKECEFSDDNFLNGSLIKTGKLTGYTYSLTSYVWVRDEHYTHRDCRIEKAE
jgi:hypothetical protein